MKRIDGSGSIELLASGRVRARLRLADGGRPSLGTFDTSEEAESVIAAALEELDARQVLPTGGVTFRGYARRYADELARSRSYVAMPNFRSILKRWLEPAPFADWPIRAVTPLAVRRWIAGLAARADVSDSHCSQCLTNLRRILEGAAREGLIDSNPAKGVEVPRRPGRTDEPWTYLSPSEQSALIGCEAIPDHWRYMIVIAIYSGMRWGELCNLQLSDIQLEGAQPHIVVRFGKRGGATKGRRIRRVPILPACRPHLVRWLQILPTWATRNPDRLVFPGKRGGFRKVSRLEDQVDGERQTFTDWLAAAGITRRVRPHDLRHTCGASLISGWWGRDWRLEEVRDFLGHASIEQTERYAHLAPGALHRAAAATGGSGGSGGGFSGPRGGPRDPESGSNSARFAISGQVSHHPPRFESFRVVNPQSGPGVVQQLALQLLRTVAGGESPGELAEQLAEAVLGQPESRLALAVLAGGPHALTRALELAGLVLEPVVADRSTEAEQ